MGRSEKTFWPENSWHSSHYGEMRTERNNFLLKIPLKQLHNHTVCSRDNLKGQQTGENDGFLKVAREKISSPSLVCGEECLKEDYSHSKTLHVTARSQLSLTFKTFSVHLFFPSLTKDF